MKMIVETEATVQFSVLFLYVYSNLAFSVNLSPIHWLVLGYQQPFLENLGYYVQWHFFSVKDLLPGDNITRNSSFNSNVLSLFYQIIIQKVWSTSLFRINILLVVFLNLLFHEFTVVQLELYLSNFNKTFS